MKKIILLFSISLPFVFANAQQNREIKETTRITIQKDKDIPSDVHQWLEDELNKAPKKHLADLDGDEFFDSQPAKIVGYIKGYTPGLGFSSGIVNLNNAFLNVDTPVTITIHEDGRFEVGLPMDHPLASDINIQHQYIPFYIEPGQTLSMVLDWKDFQRADSLQTMKYESDRVKYDGTTDQINTELAKAYSSLTKPSYWSNEKVRSNDLTLEEMTEHVNRLTAEYNERLENYIAKEKPCKQVATILRNDLLLEKGDALLRYERNLVMSDKGIKSADVPVEYFNFLKEVDYTDQKLFMTDRFETFINQIYFSAPIWNAKSAYSVVSAQLDIEAMEKEDGIVFDDEDKAFFMIMKEGERIGMDTTIRQEDKIAYFEKNKEKYTHFQEKYSRQISDYMTREMIRKGEETELKQYAAIDSAVQNILGLKGWIAEDVLKSRMLHFFLNENRNNGYEKEQAYQFMSRADGFIDNEIVKMQVGRLLTTMFPEEGNQPREFMDVEGGDIMRKIIAPYKGKILFVDFWGIFCAPCVYQIKEMKAIREKYKDREDFAFLFITGEGETPQDRYNKFIEEQELTNTFRIPEDDFKKLRHLFQFVGIPHYIVLNGEGRILVDGFQMHNFEFELDKILRRK